MSITQITLFVRKPNFSMCHIYISGSKINQCSIEIITHNTSKPSRVSVISDTKNAKFRVFINTRLQYLTTSLTVTRHSCGKRINTLIKPVFKNLFWRVLFSASDHPCGFFIHQGVAKASQ